MSDDDDNDDDDDDDDDERQADRIHKYASFPSYLLRLLVLLWTSPHLHPSRALVFHGPLPSSRPSLRDSDGNGDDILY